MRLMEQHDTSYRRPILILGVGNILLRDEGVGVRVIEAMQKITLSPDVELCDGGTAGADLLDIVADRRKLIVVDTADAEVPPGTVLKMGPEDLAKDIGHGISLHEFGVSQTLMMANQLKCSPKKVVIFGIKPFEITYNAELTPQMTALIPRLVEVILAEAGVND